MVSREKRPYLLLLPILSAIVAIIILVRIGYLTLFGSTKTSPYTNPPIANRVVRGSIYDRNGSLLAIEEPYWGCALFLQEIDDLSYTLSLIAPILNIDVEDATKEASKRSSYYLIKRRLEKGEVEELSSLIANKTLIGVTLEKQYGRFYPQHYHLSQIIGFANRENKGLEGLELLYDKTLSPYPRWAETITYGSDLYLTIDLRLQYLLDQQVVEIDKKHLPDSIVALMLDAKTAEVLAATTFPWYDLNSYQDSDVERRQNKIVTSMYEPGSVFKIFSLAALLEADQASFDEPFYCDGTYTFTTPSGQKESVRCVSAHGVVDPQSMLKYSCNGAVAHWALQTDTLLFSEKLKQLGFGSKTGIDLVGEIGGSLRELSSWSYRSKPTIAFGQEIATTALQLATGATALANGGMLLTPHIVAKIVDSDGTVYPYLASDDFSQVLSGETAQIVLDGMIAATESGGTASKAAVEGVVVAAKTGTAQIINPATKEYDESSFLASTLAIFPADNPQYIIYIGVLNPQGATIWGSNIAAPAIKEVIEDMVRLGMIHSESMPHITD